MIVIHLYILIIWYFFNSSFHLMVKNVRHTQQQV